MNVNIGPGANWVKPCQEWVTVDVDSKRGDIVIDFNSFDKFPWPDNSIDLIYASHVLEHISIYKIDEVLKECYRVLKPAGVMRIVLPDVGKSIREYLASNTLYPLFIRRRDRAKKLYNKDYTLFDCLREDFLSKSSQPNLLGENTLGHQNAWDYISIARDLKSVGFSPIYEMEFGVSFCTGDFNFETEQKSEAMESDRSIYLEAIK